MTYNHKAALRAAKKRKLRELCHGMTMLRPFWRYYGGKWRNAPRYPHPRHNSIIEPFAGAAGYSMHYPNLNVILVERYPIIAEIWRYLIGVKPSEVRRIPCVDHVDDLPVWVPNGARSLVGFSMNSATVSPCKMLSAGMLRNRNKGKKIYGWTETMRERVASQVSRVKHWQIIEGEYTDAPDIKATWFVDPPYNNRVGRYYVHNDIDYFALGDWCRERRGQVIVCENDGATWLPFRPFQRLSNSMTGKTSTEVIWTNEYHAKQVSAATRVAVE